MSGTCFNSTVVVVVYQKYRNYILLVSVTLTVSIAHLDISPTAVSFSHLSPLHPQSWLNPSLLVSYKWNFILSQAERNELMEERMWREQEQTKEAVSFLLITLFLCFSLPCHCLCVLVCALAVCIHLQTFLLSKKTPGPVSEKGPLRCLCPRGSALTRAKGEEEQ